MELKYNLVEVLATNYALIRKKFIGRLPKHTLNNNSEDIEDIFSDKVLFLLENYSTHYNSSYQSELDFINKLIKTKLQPSRNKDVHKVLYHDNYDNSDHSDHTDTEYYLKLQQLLIQYKIKNTKK